MKLRIAAIFAFLWAVPAFAGPAENEVAAAAKSWLVLVDAKNYAQCYQTAADIVRQGVSEAKWEELVKFGRGKAGALKSRKFQAVQFTKTLPGVPEGDYANVAFDSDFETKGPATEVITLVHEHGQWKVGGYHIANDTDQQ
jgi:hypothetical protein